MSDEKVWRGWTHKRFAEFRTPDLYKTDVSADPVEVVVCKAADYYALLARIAELEKKDG